MNKSPKLMNFSRMRDIFEPHLAQIKEHIFFTHELGIVHGDPQVFQLIIQQKPPFIIDDYRMGIVVNGKAKVSINLVEKQFEAGMLIYVGPGSIISPIEYSDDLELFGMALFNSFPMPFAPGQIPSAFNGQVRDFQINGNEDDIKTVRSIIDTLWQVVHLPVYHQQTIGSLVAALLHFYDGLYQQHTDRLQHTQSREQTIFDRFIYLVNQHATQEHQIRFYADKMCLTERYLGTVIRQASGTTAKEWIDRSLLNHIKAALRHTDKSVAQIAEEMNFPNPSFFSKYFKRLTNMTPAEFRGI